MPWASGCWGPIGKCRWLRGPVAVDSRGLDLEAPEQRAGVDQGDTGWTPNDGQEHLGVPHPIVGTSPQKMHCGHWMEGIIA